MTEQFKYKRAIFPPDGQRKFLELVGEKMSVADMARVSNRSERAIRDWQREKFSMLLTAVHAFSKQANVSIPTNVKVQEAYAHNAKAGKIGIAAVKSKYGRIPGNEQHRKEKWQIWWESEGKFKKNQILKSKVVHKPKRSVRLAEFIGIMMGDGGISDYQVTITLHHVDDLEYASFVKNNIEKLFKVTPSVYHSPDKSVNNIVVSRKEMVAYLHELGLPKGNKVKQQFDIPGWIKNNQKFSIACLRGLIDTDGSVFTHRYRSKGTMYAYKKLSFTSASAPLRHSVQYILDNLGFHPRLTKQGVRLESGADMKRYFTLIGSHNPKHLRRYESTLG